MADVEAFEAFKAFERQGWAAKAESYDLLTGRITARFVEPLLDAAGVGAGLDVLDVGSGPGYAARRAAERGAIVTGIDSAEGMVSLARRRHPGIRFLCADAQELPFADGSFDAVVANFSINHLPQPELALGEFARVAAAGASIALSAWDAPERGGYPAFWSRLFEIAALPIRTISRPGRTRTVSPMRMSSGRCCAERGSWTWRSTAWRSASSSATPTSCGKGCSAAAFARPGSSNASPRILGRGSGREWSRLAEQHRDEGGLAVPVRGSIARGTKV